MDDIIASAMLVTRGQLDPSSRDDAVVDIVTRDSQHTAPAEGELPISFHQPSFGMLSRETPEDLSRIRR